MINAETIARLRELEAKATKGPWEFDTERQDDAPDRHHEYAVFSPSGGRLFGTENRAAEEGLIEYEYSEDGVYCWNVLSRNDVKLIAALRNAAPALLSAAEENARLREALDAGLQNLNRDQIHGILRDALAASKGDAE